MKIANWMIGAAMMALSSVAPATAQNDDGPVIIAGYAVDEIAADTENWRLVPAENVFVFETSKGTIVIEALPEVAPNHVEQFRTIIRSGDYDGTTFHRVIDNFMAQGGDIFAAKGRDSGLPNLEGEFHFDRDPVETPVQTIGEPLEANRGFYMGAPVATQKAWLSEINESGTVETWIMHCPGVVSTARTDDPNSANSQFFLMRGEQPGLDKEYTAWGRIVGGLDNVYAIKSGLSSQNGVVQAPDVLQSAYVLADQPEDARMTVYAMRTDGPKFLSRLANVPVDRNICDLEPVPSVVVPAPAAEGEGDTGEVETRGAVEE